MKIKMAKPIKYSLLSVSAIICLLILSLQARTAIQQVAGLAVAQSSITWNNVIDAAVGDAQTKGIMAVSPYVFNGSTFDRLRGTNGSLNVSANGGSTPLTIVVNAANSIGVKTGVSLGAFYKYHTWTIIITGGPSPVSVNLEGSIDSTDGSNGHWGVLDNSTTTSFEVRSVAYKGVTWLRAHILTLTGGSAPTVTIESISGGN